MPTLIVAGPPFVPLLGGDLPLYFVYDGLLAEAARAVGWSVVACYGKPLPTDVPDPVVYVTTDLAVAAARQLRVSLLEPPLGLLADVPRRFVGRTVEFARFADLVRLHGPTFVKPADPLDKWFDAGVYSDTRDVRTRGRGDPDAPVLLSEPVEWTAEFRCFVLDGKVVAGSPYLSFGRPAWQLFDPRRPVAVPAAALAVVEGVCKALGDRLPPGFVVDVGLIDDRGWAVVEFNPAWSAGLLGADPRAVLSVLRRTTRRLDELTDDDRRWVVGRPG
jgi:hypothetical protein